MACGASYRLDAIPASPGAVYDDGAADLLGHEACRAESLAMNRSDVTKDQAKKLSRGLYPVQNYLYRLRRRMEQVGFPLTDPLFALVDAACDAGPPSPHLRPLPDL